MPDMDDIPDMDDDDEDGMGGGLVEEEDDAALKPSVPSVTPRHHQWSVGTHCSLR